MTRTLGLEPGLDETADRERARPARESRRAAPRVIAALGVGVVATVGAAWLAALTSDPALVPTFGVRFPPSEVLVPRETMREHYGWPIGAMKAVFETEIDDDGNLLAGTTAVIVGIDIGTAKAPRALPTRVLTIGFAVDVVLYAIATWLVLTFAAHAQEIIRERSRRHRGLCVRCAYPVIEGRCPECGTPVLA